MKKKILLIIFIIEIFIIGIATKEKYPKYLVIYRNNTFKVSNKPYLLESNNKNEYPDKCFINFYKKVWDIGTIYNPPDECKRMTCTENGRIQVEHCGAVTADGIICRTHREGDGPYPACCWIFKCKARDNKEFLYNPLTPYEGDLEEE
ncbi:uncharacterized protein LOC129611422 [Condylostylus longicornis]|uniref:uncharacterized protein LOC129611422 n=1 Tax=Condylostylus longicornis TaxID=2530218 RepID=UPI00244DC672|nr:uncharacterized protein LOC129611422 [Condylostylus longicornis]